MHLPRHKYCQNLLVWKQKDQTKYGWFQNGKSKQTDIEFETCYETRQEVGTEICQHAIQNTSVLTKPRLLWVGAQQSTRTIVSNGVRRANRKINKPMISFDTVFTSKSKHLEWMQVSVYCLLFIWQGPENVHSSSVKMRYFPTSHLWFCNCFSPPPSSTLLPLAFAWTVKKLSIQQSLEKTITTPEILSCPDTCIVLEQKIWLKRGLLFSCKPISQELFPLPPIKITSKDEIENVHNCGKSEPLLIHYTFNWGRLDSGY